MDSITISWGCLRLPGVISFLYVDPSSDGLSMASQSTLTSAKTTPASTISQALAAATAGTAIYLKEGSYNATNSTTQTIHINNVASGTVDNPIWITCETKHGAVINGPTNQSCIRVNDEQYWRLYKLDIRPNFPSSDSDFAGVKVESASSSDPTPMHLGIYNCAFGGTACDAIKLGTVANIDIQGNHIEGDWKESSVDLVGCENVEVAYNTIINTGTATEPGIQGKAGCRNISFHHNYSEAEQEALAIGGNGTSAQSRTAPSNFEWSSCGSTSTFENSVLVGRSTVQPVLEIRGAFNCTVNNVLLKGPAASTHNLIMAAASRNKFYSDKVIGDVPVGRDPYVDAIVNATFDYEIYSTNLVFTNVLRENGSANITWNDTQARDDPNNSVVYAGTGTEASLGVSIGATAWPGLS